ncbi:MAG: Sir2 family NAD-dependent protein deacetylase [Rubrivivax sp.]|nr:Sir2 family NAD-dependent protein deacetylase [Rubrivivax sp.]
MTPDPAAIHAAAALIADADALLVGAGAGMGVDSGLPDFRGTAGFWRAYPALGRRGLKFHEIASPQTFDADPTLAWGFYGHRLALYRSTRPHAGFDILRRWGTQMRHGCGVFTSNVDGHFQRAGFDGARVAECHGSIHHLQCTRPCSEAVWPADDFQPETDDDACQLCNAPPTCPRCGAIARPNILMFGDGGWSSERSDAQEARLQRWLGGAGRLVVVEIGAGTAIPSVRHFSQTALTDHDAVLVRINPREAEVSRRRDISIAGPALATLRAIEDVLSARRGRLA